MTRNNGKNAASLSLKVGVVGQCVHMDLCFKRETASHTIALKSCNNNFQPVS